MRKQAVSSKYQHSFSWAEQDYYVLNLNILSYLQRTNGFIMAVNT